MCKVAYSSNQIIPPDYWTYQVKTNKTKCADSQYIDLRIT